jgi:hypothetical protein
MGNGESLQTGKIIDRVRLVHSSTSRHSDTKSLKPQTRACPDAAPAPKRQRTAAPPADDDGGEELGSDDSDADEGEEESDEGEGGAGLFWPVGWVWWLGRPLLGRVCLLESNNLLDNQTLSLQPQPHPQICRRHR